MRLKVFMGNNVGSTLRRGLAAALLTALAFGTAACTTSTGLIDAATTVAEDRPMAQVARDAEIKLDINKRLLGEKNRDLFFDVSTDVYEGRVMLTGSVKNARDRQRAGRLATDIPGVKIIYNDLQVTQKEGFKTSANDIWIETKIKAQLYAEKGIKSIHFRFRSVNTAIYLLGRARTLEEMNKVILIIKRTKYVTRVVNHAVIRPVAPK
jgi:osmotically-inducible protein OsmY